jgi:hypothetical protein
MPTSPTDQPEDQSLLDTDILSELGESIDPLVVRKASVQSATCKGGEGTAKHTKTRNERRADHTGHYCACSGVEQTIATPPKASYAWRKRRSVLRPMRGSRGSWSVTDLSVIVTGMTLCWMASRIE